MSIGTRIYAGFGVVLFLLLVLATTAWKGIDGASSAFERYARSVDVAGLAGRMDTNMSDSLSQLMNIRLGNRSQKSRESSNEQKGSLHANLGKIKLGLCLSGQETSG